MEKQTNHTKMIMVKGPQKRESREIASTDVQSLKTLKLLDKLVGRRLEFDKKYQMVNMPKLLRENCETDMNSVWMVIGGLEILAKYCENLFNPQSLRPQKWLAISFHNQTFMEKVQPIKGHREILKLIGYTREERGYLVHDGEDTALVYTAAQVYLEIKAIQLELKLWLEKRHPYPDLFEGLLSGNVLRSQMTEPCSRGHDNAEKVENNDSILGVQNSMESISPNATLTLQNARILLRQVHKPLKSPEVIKSPPYDSILRRSKKGERSKHFPIYDSDFVRSNTDPEKPKRMPLYIGSRSLHDHFEEIWVCKHCTTENHHGDKPCRRGSKPSVSDLASLPKEQPHTCQVCFKTTFVYCHHEVAIVTKRMIKSIMPFKPMVEKKEDEAVPTEARGSGRRGDDSGDDNGDYNSKMKQIQMRKTQQTKLIWNNRLEQFIKLLHEELGQVPDEEIHHLFSRLESNLYGRSGLIFQDFNNAVQEVLKEWKLAVDQTSQLLKKHKVYRDKPSEEESFKQVKACLTATSGNPGLAFQRFMERWKGLVDSLMKECMIPDLSPEDYSDVLFNCGGVVEEAIVCLIKNRYLYVVWGQGGSNQGSGTDLYRDTRLFDPLINRAVKNKTISKEKRVRMLMCECDFDDTDLANQVVEMIDSSTNGNELCIVDFLEALEENNSINEARKQLMRDCPICACSKPIRSFLKLPRCDCTVCKQCVKRYFEIRIMQDPISSLVCPCCSNPKILDNFSDSDYFVYLTKLLSNILDEKSINALGEKLAKWNLKDEKVAHCPWDNCEEQFIIDNSYVVVVMCPNCFKTLCTNCLKKWVDEHHDCNASDTHNIEKDLKSCPKCRQAYYLVKGGCLHMICSNCNHQFCSQCDEPYHKNGCNVSLNCSSMGLHCHHPRDCFFYLRDINEKNLLQLFEIYKVKIPVNFHPSSNQALSLPPPTRSPTEESKLVGALVRSTSMCQTWVQKNEEGHEEMCGGNLYSEELGLCSLHYKEYLCNLINLHNMDPVHIMNETEIKTLLSRWGIMFPEKFKTNGDYLNQLIKIVKEKIPLKRRSVLARPPSIYPQTNYEEHNSFGLYSIAGQRATYDLSPHVQQPQQRATYDLSPHIQQQRQATYNLSPHDQQQRATYDLLPRGLISQSSTPEESTSQSLTSQESTNQSLTSNSSFPNVISRNGQHQSSSKRLWETLPREEEIAEG